MLSVAQDLVDQLTPYQTALTAAINTAASLPLIGEQFEDLQQLDTILQNALQSIESQTQSLSSGHFQLAIPLPSFSDTFTFDLGLDAFLQVSTAGGVAIAVNPVLNIGFDYQNGTVTLDADDTNLDLGFSLSLPNFQASMSFNGLLFTQAVDAGTIFDGHLLLEFEPGNGVTAEFSGDAHIRLNLAMSFVDPATNADFNPTFRTRLEVDWGFDTQSGQLGIPEIALVDFGLDADSFMHGFFGDIVQTMQKYTKPLQPFIDVFETPVPILSSFDSSQTIGDLMLKGAGLSEEMQDRFNFAIEIIGAVNSMDLSGNTGGAVIPFGTINLTGNALQSGGFNFDTSQITSVIDDIFNVPALDELQETLETVANYAGLNSTAGFKFHLLENPGPVIGAILTGQTESIFSYSTGRQHFELSPSIGVGIEDIIGIFLSAGIVFDAQLSVGYDTAGLIKVAQTHNPADLLHGFYFDNSVDTSGPPIPNVSDPRKTALYLQGFMELKASAIATLSGGLYGNVSVELASTDSSSHVHLDSMIQNLGSGSKVFDLSGALYAQASIELTVPTPVGPNITLLEYELGRIDLINFDPPPSPGLGRPLTIVDVTDQHTLLLDTSKMTPGSAVKVQPFHDYVAAGTTYAGDSIRVDYANEIVLYVMRKDDVTTNYYNLIGVNGAIPDGVTIEIVDPFGIFAAEGATNPAPAQTTPGVLLAGGKNVVYKYSEAANGSHPTVLLAGGYGSNTLAGGTMMFGNFIPGDRIAQAKAHFGNITGYDAVGQALINSMIDAAIAPANPAGIIGSTMTGSRGGLMIGGPGSNSFIATGPGAYEMIGGAWVDSFDISPSFGGVPATYAIDGGPGGGNNLIVRAPAGENITFENSTIADKYAPAFKALAVQANAGLSATAHGIKKVQIIATPGASVTIGDTSEIDAEFSIRGGVDLTFGGTSAPDIFVVTTEGPYHGLANHYSPDRILHYTFTEPGVPSGTSLFGWGGIAFPLPDPVYSVTRTFGTNGRTQTIPFAVSNATNSSIKLNAGGASDTYSISMGLGAFIDVAVNDTDASSTNALTVFTGDGSLIYNTLNFTDTAIELDYYTVAYLWSNYTEYNTYYPYTISQYMSSAHYTPTVAFSGNVLPTVQTAIPFQQATINRPIGNQVGKLLIGGAYSSTPIPYIGLGVSQGAWDVSTDPWTKFDPQPLQDNLDIVANSGSFVVEKSPLYNVPGMAVNIHSNNGTLTFAETQIWNGYYDTFNVLGNAGTLNISTLINATYGSGGVYVQGLGRVVNVIANSGTINLQNTMPTNLINYGIESQVNIGSGGSLANIHGTINLANSNGHYGLKIDDRTNPGAGASWIVNNTKTEIGDLTINHLNVNLPAPYFDNFSKFEAFPKPSSIVTLGQDPPFYQKLYNGGAFPISSLSAPYSLFQTDGTVVNQTISASGPPGTTLTFAASNLPAGLSINPSTGLISGTIAPGAWRTIPYETIITVSAGQYSRAARINWYVSSGINITVDHYYLPYFEGESASATISATNVYNLPVTFTVTGLPPGISFDANTSTIGGTISPGAAASGPYVVNIHATDGVETADYNFNWNITGITLSTPATQIDFVGDSVNLAVQGSTVSGAPLVYSAQGLPDGLSIDANTGVVSGTVTAAAGETRMHYPSITATDGNDSAMVYFTWATLPVGVSNYISIEDPGPRNSREGDGGFMYLSVDRNTLNLPITYSVTGLPPGVDLFGAEGSSYYINGTIAEGAASASPYHVEIVATDGIWSDTLQFDWIVRPPGTVYAQDYYSQFAIVNQTINFGVYAYSSLGETLEYSATGLPPGLTINPATGLISGTVLPLAGYPGIYQTSVTATSASDSDTTSFLWHVRDTYQSNLIRLPNPSGVGTFNIMSPAGTRLSASISPNAGVTLPAGVEFPYDFLTFTIEYLQPGQAADLTITGLDPSIITDYYKYGATPANPTEHWYNFLFNLQTDGDSATGTGMEIVGDTIVLRLVDGGRGDDDLAMNGIIFDIGGPAIAVPPPELPGDYNLDGRVNAADYVLWRDTLGSTTNLVANGDASNNIIDIADYGVWKANFGQPQSESSGLASDLSMEGGGGGKPFSAMEAAFASFDGRASSTKPKLAKPLGGVPTFPDGDALLLLATSFVASETDDNDDTIKFRSEEEWSPDDAEWDFGDALLDSLLLEVS